MRRINGALISGDTDRSSASAGHQVRSVTKFFDYFRDAFNILFRRVGFHYYQHI